MDFYIRVQLLCEEDNLATERSKFIEFCRMFPVKLQMIDDHHQDSFVVYLTGDLADDCFVINALYAYFHFHEASHNLSTGNVGAPVVDIDLN